MSLKYYKDHSRYRSQCVQIFVVSQGPNLFHSGVGCEDSSSFLNTLCLRGENLKRVLTAVE